MSNFEVPNPILSSPFEEPKEHWWILEGQYGMKIIGLSGNELLMVNKLEEWK